MVGPISVVVASRAVALIQRLVGELGEDVFSTTVRSDVPTDGSAGGCDLLVVDLAVDPEGQWRELRRTSQASVVLLGGDPDRVPEMIEAGADDVILRPERCQEVAARIRAIARRRQSAPTEVTVAAEVQLSRERHEVIVRGQRLDLPLKQYQLLDLLVSNPGRVLTRSRILDHLWGLWPPDQSNALDVQVRRLRKAIEREPHRPKLICTVRGVGYRYDPGEPTTRSGR